MVRKASELSAELQKEALLISEILDKLKSTLETLSTSPQSSMKLCFRAVVDEFAVVMNNMATHVQPIQKSNIKERFKWPFAEKEHEQFLPTFVSTERSSTLHSKQSVHKFLNVL